MDQAEFEEESSSTMEDEEISDEESSSRSKPIVILGHDGLITMDEGSLEHVIVKKSFLMGMGSLAKDTEVVSIHKNTGTTIMSQARLKSFRILSKAVAAKRGGDANVKHAWYGASKNEISMIISHGFSRLRRASNCGVRGFGVHLSAAKFSIDGALSSEEDESGLRHVLSCHVILGNVEVIKPGSRQILPSSQDFDCGIDNSSEPRRYIVWTSFMNSHIFPAYIISFRAPSLKDTEQVQASSLRSTPVGMRFSNLQAILERFLPPSKMKLIAKFHSDFHMKRITNKQLLYRVRQIAGDKLLTLAIENASK